ncbi:branched-chain amino acid ABC transporter ATP-binding protein [Aureimonas sp. SA4125]|nr:branched-chain amino acid ABC transporter ATP-binding protein [Aureimonas sp. SA4125]
MVVRDVSIRIDAGEIVAVLGKNGMGKSTLLRTIMGFVRARAGKVIYEGADITNRAPHLNARASISHTPQEFTIFQDLTVADNLRLGVPVDRMLDERVSEIEEAFPVITKRFQQRAGTLSGGEQKMLLLSRALVARPKIMLIDEISEGLQPTMVSKMAEVLKRTKERHAMSILIVEQNLPFALRVADRYAILKIGAIVASGRTDEGSAADLIQHLQI